MELRQLKYFIAIVESGSFSRAAIRLSVGQPILSRQIKALEAEFGVDLYHRTGRGVLLTEAGKMLEQYARGILETTANAQRDLSSLGKSPRGPVSIGMPPSVGAALAVPVIQQFCARYPDISLGVMEGFSAHVLEWLMAGRIDIAVLYLTPRIHALATDHLLTDELFLLGPVSDPAGVGNGEAPTAILKEVPLILPSRPHGLRLLIEEYMSKIGLAPNIRLEIDAMPSTLRLVESGLAYTILSYSCVHHLVEAGKIRCWRMIEPNMTRSLVIATSTQRPSTKASRALTGFVREQAQGMVAQGRWNPNL